MKKKRVYVAVFALGFLLALTQGPGLAQQPAERTQPRGDLSVEAMVGSKFSYQGVLRENGVPVTGARDMVFRLFSDADCTASVGSDMVMPDVAVDAGLFDVELSVSLFDINGQQLWLRTQVEGVTVGCQEILPVPYALSLRPGAAIEGNQNGWDALHLENTATSSKSYGVYAQSDSTGGAGVYARGLDAGADLILAGNADTLYGDDGRIRSDPDYDSSDIHLITNDGVRIDLDEDGDGEDADFEIRNKDNTLIFNVDESGDVRFGGTGVAAFPRPAYDSGWVSIAPGATTYLTHSLGISIDDYVVDLTCKSSTGAGVNNMGVGGDINSPDSYGAWWRNLTTSTIRIRRLNDDTDCPNVRVRIWVYP